MSKTELNEQEIIQIHDSKHDETKSNFSDESLKDISSPKTQPKKTCLKSRIPEHNVPVIRSECVIMDNFERVMRNNLKWSEQNLQNDADFFARMKHVQTPEFLWIGCSDSRVPANEVVGLKPGELFVHRNIANQAPLSDINVLAVIQYSV